MFVYANVYVFAHIFAPFATKKLDFDLEITLQ